MANTNKISGTFSTEIFEANQKCCILVVLFNDATKWCLKVSNLLMIGPIVGEEPQNK
jgi:hypothetical protein